MSKRGFRDLDERQQLTVTDKDTAGTVRRRNVITVRFSRARDGHLTGRALIHSFWQRPSTGRVTPGPHYQERTEPTFDVNEILISDIKGSARQHRVGGREVAQARRHAVNGGTRSGKEVLAYGFKKYHLGELIGMPTARSVLAATAFLMGNGDLLLVAVEDVLVEGQRPSKGLVSRPRSRCRSISSTLPAGTRSWSALSRSSPA
jgi:hypothetical protein